MIDSIRDGREMDIIFLLPYWDYLWRDILVKETTIKAMQKYKLKQLIKRKEQQSIQGN